jgi:hypothetical protein
VALSLNRVIIERLQRRNTSQKPSRNVTNVAVVSVSKGRATGGDASEIDRGIGGTATSGAASDE